MYGVFNTAGKAHRRHAARLQSLRAEQQRHQHPGPDRSLRAPRVCSSRVIDRCVTRAEIHNITRCKRVPQPPLGHGQFIRSHLIPPLPDPPDHFLPKELPRSPLRPNTPAVNQQLRMPSGTCAVALPRKRTLGLVSELDRRGVPVDQGAWVDRAVRRMTQAVALRDVVALAEAVTMFEDSYHAANRSMDPNRVTRLINFAGALLDQYDQARVVEALEQAVTLLESADHSVPHKHPLRLEYLCRRGRAQLRSAQLTGEKRAINRAVGSYRKALDIATRGHPRHNACLMELGVALVHRHHMTGSLADLDQAITVLTAASKCPEAPTSRSAVMSTLGNAWLAKYQRVEGTDSTDLYRAVRAHFVAVRAVAPGDPHEAGYYSDLGTALMKWHERTQSRSALEKSITWHRRADTATTPEHSEKAVRLANLATALRTSHEYTKDPVVLDEAIGLFRQAAGLTPEGHGYYARSRFQLAAVLFRRGELRGAAYDFYECSILAEKSYRATPPTHPDRPGRLALFAEAVFQLGGPSSLRVADEYLAEATADLPPGHFNRVMLESNHGAILNARFERDPLIRQSSRQAREFLGRAIELTRSSVEGTVQNHTEYLGRLGNFAAASANLAKLTGDVSRLDDVLRLCRETRELQTSQAAQAIHALINAGALSCAYQIADDTAFLDFALSDYEFAVRAGSAPAELRLRAAYDAAHLAAVNHRLDVAEAMFVEAVDLMDRVVWRGMGRRDQERVLNKCGTLSTDAAAIAIETGHLERAVELLERGRGLLLERRIDDDVDLTAVYALDSHLAHRFEEVRAELNAIVIPDVDIDGDDDIPDHPAHLASPIDRRSEIAQELESIIERIRALPGQQAMFRPLGFSKIQQMLGREPTVVLNVSRFRCDALVLSAEGVELTPLPETSAADFQGYATFFLNGAADAYRDDKRGQCTRDRMTEALEWMWDAFAERLLRNVGILAACSHDSPPPHITWCPTGHAAFLPLHAAGHHDPAGQAEVKTVIDRAASSYIPKLRALAALRAAPTGPCPGEPLVVSMPKTPDQRDLPGSEVEAHELTTYFPDATHLSGPAATVEAVDTALSGHSWAHFTLHGTANDRTPTKSGLILHNGLLTVQHLTEKHLPDARFAFLSACETSRGTPNLPDESVTLGTALWLAGYYDVIATLWPISDQHTPEFARHVYQSLICVDRGFSRLDPGNSAEAVRHAACQVREAHDGHPERWAPFVHTGPGPRQ